MTKKFLTAKHWQIFLFVFMIPFSLQWIFMSLPYFKSNPNLMMKLPHIFMVIFGIGFLGWFWSIATGLQILIPPEIKMNLKKFKILFFIPLIFIPIAFSALAYFPQGKIEAGLNENGLLIGIFVIMVMSLHLTSMFGILYSIYFAAKTLKTVELQRETIFADFAGDMFLIYFFPIGIWVIQPRVNTILNIPC